MMRVLGHIKCACLFEQIVWHLHKGHKLLKMSVAFNLICSFKQANTLNVSKNPNKFSHQRENDRFRHLGAKTNGGKTCMNGNEKNCVRLYRFRLRACCLCLLTTEIHEALGGKMRKVILRTTPIILEGVKNALT